MSPECSPRGLVLEPDVEQFLLIHRAVHLALAGRE